MFKNLFVSNQKSIEIFMAIFQLIDMLIKTTKILQMFATSSESFSTIYIIAIVLTFNIYLDFFTFMIEFFDFMEKTV
jgi:hypothetical protein